MPSALPVTLAEPLLNDPVEPGSTPSGLVAGPDGQPLLLWRGESSGVLYDTFDRRQTNAGVGFFFAEDQRQAAFYAGLGSAPRAFHLKAANVLDLLDPYDPSVRPFVQAFAEEFDEWVDRYSGEPMDVFSYLEAGALYDYEGTGRGTRWNALFRLAEAEGYDAVVVRDQTDGVDAPVWVVFQPEQIVHVPHATPRLAPEAPEPRRRAPGW